MSTLPMQRSRFDFQIALIVALVLHISLLVFLLWKNRVEPQDIPFKTLQIKIGRSDLQSSPVQHKGPLVAPGLLDSRQKQKAAPSSSPQGTNSSVQPLSTSLSQSSPPATVKPMKQLAKKEGGGAEALPVERTDMPKEKIQERPQLKMQQAEGSAGRTVINPFEANKDFYSQEMPPEGQVTELQGARGSIMGNDKQGKESITSYTELLPAHLNRYAIYPELAKRNHIEGRAIVKLYLSRNGDVQRYVIVEKTGHPILDDQIEDIIARASPFPPVPASEINPVYKVPINFLLGPEER